MVNYHISCELMAAQKAQVFHRVCINDAAFTGDMPAYIEPHLLPQSVPTTNLLSFLQQLKQI